MKKLYKFYWNYGRMGDVQCIFVEEESVVKNCIGKTVCFGEILGKHSEVVGKLEEEDLTVLTDDQHAIEIIEKYIGSSFGHNPIDIIIENEE